jgi:hypothetical protein
MWMERIAAYLCVANEWSGRHSRQGFPEHELSLHQTAPCTVGELQLISSTSDVVKNPFSNFRNFIIDRQTDVAKLVDEILQIFVAKAVTTKRYTYDIRAAYWTACVCVTSIYKNRTDFMRAVNSCSLYRTDRKRSESIKNRIHVT